MLQQLASALRVSTPVMYLRAGLLDLKDGQGVLAAIASDTDLTASQKQTLTQIYETFRRENARDQDIGVGRDSADDASPAPSPAAPSISTRVKKVAKAATSARATTKESS